jgi:hypothetical protein
LKSPPPSPNVMVPKQSLETKSPVSPSVEYSKNASSIAADIGYGFKCEA